MVDYKKIILGFLLFMVASSIIYVQLSNDVKFRIDEDKTTLYIKDLNDAGEPVGRWKVAGREYSKIMDGSSNTNRDTKNIYIETAYKDENGSLTILRDNKEVTESKWIALYNQLKPNQFSAIRVTPYIRGHTVIDTYLFDGTLDDVELVPLKHLVTVLNGEGLFLRYYIDDIYEPGEKEKLNGDTSTVFGRLKVDFQEGYNWAWIGWPYGKDSFAVQYKIESNDESFELRLFDPIIEPSPRENDYAGLWKFDNSMLGEERIVDGDMSSSTGWIPNGDWEISGGTANYNNTGASSTLQQNSVYDTTPGYYQITFTITEINAGSFRPYCSGYGTIRDAVGTYSEIMYNDDGLQTFYLLGASADGKVDDISVKKLDVVDLSEIGRDLTPVVGSSVSFETDQNGKENGATIFDGETSYFTLDGSDSQYAMGTEDLTINVWAKTTSINDQRIIQASSYYIQVFGGVMKAYFNGTEISEVMNLDVGNWAMYSFVYDRDGDLSLYRNAEFQRAVDISSGDGYNFTGATNPIYIASLAGTSRFWNGSISELGIIHKALSQEELEALYTVGNNKIIQYNSPRDSDYIGVWKLNSQETTKINDLIFDPINTLTIGDATFSGNTFTWNGSGYARNSIDGDYIPGKTYRITLNTTDYGGATPYIYLQRLVVGDIVFDDDGVALKEPGIHIVTSECTRDDGSEYFQIQNNVAGVNVSVQLISIEESDNSFEDLSGDDNAKLVNNLPSFETDQNGVENGALVFDGVDDYVDTNYTLDGKENFSIDFWMNTEYTGSGTNGLIGQSQVRLMLRPSAGSTQVFRIYGYNETTNTQVLQDTENLADGNWYYIVVNKDSDGWEYWRNGELRLTSTSIGGPVKITPGTFKMGYPSSDYLTFNGSMSEAGIMDRPMTEEEILAKYKVGRNKQIIYSPVSKGLVFQAHTTNQYFDGDRFIAPGPFEINTYDIDESIVRQNGTEMNGSIFTRIIEVPDTTDSVIDMTDELTLEAVVYLRDRIAYNCLITKGDNFAYNQQNYGLCFENSQTQLIINKSVYSDAYDFPLDEWLDVVMTWDGTNIKLYVNGDLKITKAHSGTITPDNTKLRLGNFYNQEDIDGIFKVGRVYNRALTTNEIEHNYEVEKQWWT